MEFKKITDDPELAGMVIRGRAKAAKERPEGSEATKPGPPTSNLPSASSAVKSSPHRVRRAGERPEDRERAFERYVADQARARTAAAKQGRNRAVETWPRVVAWLNRELATLWTLMVHGEKRFDEAVTLEGSRVALRFYAMAVSFFLAHSLLIVSPKAHRARLAVCGGCTYRRVDDHGVGRCYGARNGQGCGCLDVWWWFPSRLGWQLWLRNFPCSLKRFNRWGRVWNLTAEDAESAEGKRGERPEGKEATRQEPLTPNLPSASSASSAVSPQERSDPSIARKLAGEGGGSDRGTV